MNIKEYLYKIIDIFSDEGIEDVELYYENEDKKYVSVENSSIETFETINAGGINVSGNYNEHNATTYIEKYDEQSIYDAAHYIKQIAGPNKCDKKIRKFKTVCTDECIETNAVDIDINNVIDKLIQTEKFAKSVDARITSITECSFSFVNNNIIMIDNDKNIIEDSYKYCVGTVSVVAEENGAKNNASKSSIKNSFEALDYNNISIDAVKDAVMNLNASSIKSGSYKILLRNNVFADIISGFLPIFELENVKKGLSKVNNIIGSIIADSKLTIVEDPYYENGKIKRNFDDQGNKIDKKYIIKNGKLSSLLSIEDNNSISSGNAFRYSYKDKIDVSTTNCIVECGNTTTEKIISNIDEGIMICDVSGLHAGINSVTGDFSLISSGFYIKNGEIVRPLNQITIGGNIYDMLNEIDILSSETAIGNIYGVYIEAPSVLINKLTVGGL